MNMLRRPHQDEICYPDSDGEPLGENTLQFQWIVTITCGLDAVFHQDANVFIAGDLFWYPIEGRPDICTAPDTMVVFGRPKGHRRSYKQWKENNIPPRVAVEIMSPGNRPAQVAEKFRFYQQHGIQEYYLYDPDENLLLGWLRQGEKLVPLGAMSGWISPLLRVRFEQDAETLHLYGPDGQRFLTYAELVAKAHQEEEAKQLAQREKEQAQREKEQAQREKEQAQREKEQAQREKERLAAQLRALGIEPDV